MQIQQVVEEEKKKAKQLCTSREILLKAVKMENILKTTKTESQYKNQHFENKLNIWKNNPLLYSGTSLNDNPAKR